MNRVSVIVITLNEAANIEACLASVAWADECVVVDAESSDETVQLAKRYTDRVYVRPWEGFARAKNFALQHCSAEWVLWLDADEQVTPELRDEIQRVLQNPAASGYKIPRRARFLGRWILHSGWYPGYVLRLFRRDAGQFNDRAVHEGVELHGPVERLQHDLLHETDPTIEHYFRKFNTYTSLAAQDMHARGQRFRLTDVILRPPFQFVRMYLLKLGFLDGIQGLLLAAFSASYVFAKYAKLWECVRMRGKEGRDGPRPEKNTAAEKLVDTDAEA